MHRHLLRSRDDDDVRPEPIALAGAVLACAAAAVAFGIRLIREFRRRDRVRNPPPAIAHVHPAAPVRVPIAVPDTKASPPPTPPPAPPRAKPCRTGARFIKL